MNKQEVRLEEGCFYLEQLELGGQIIFNRYHKILSKNEDYKHRNVFFSEQFTTRNNGEIEVCTKGSAEIQRFTRNIFSQIDEKTYNSKKKEMFELLKKKM